MATENINGIEIQAPALVWVAPPSVANGSFLTVILNPDHPMHAENMSRLGTLGSRVLEAYLEAALISLRENRIH